MLIIRGGSSNLGLQALFGSVFSFSMKTTFRPSLIILLFYILFCILFFDVPHCIYIFQFSWGNLQFQLLRYDGEHFLEQTYFGILLGTMKAAKSYLKQQHMYVYSWGSIKTKTENSPMGFVYLQQVLKSLFQLEVKNR